MNILKNNTIPDAHRSGLMNARGLLPCRLVLFLFLAIFLLTNSAAALVWAGDPDYFLKVNKSIDVFGRVFKEVTLNYVEEIDPERLMHSGVDGMLDGLDPYTTFIGEGEGDEIELLTTGKYGGIGVMIGARDGYITVTSLMDGYSAQRQGILVGDRIVEIDGTSLIGSKPEKVRNLTRGEPGTIVHVKIEREGEPGVLEFSLVREEVQLKNLSYSEFVGDGIGYVRLDRFSRGAGDELRLAIKELKLKGELKGLILDLRENPGGLLESAVDVVSKFVSRGSLIVNTRGRKLDSERRYISQEEPMLQSEPLVLLVNRNSASASEIVAGAIQDLDRGIVLGMRTFGKGLVQTVTPLVYGAQLKMTTAKYYTPSGRCIQEIDYMHKNKDGVFTATPDSMRREFQTARGRKVFELGGISPDSVVESPETSTLHQELQRKSMFFKFATNFTAQHKDSLSMAVEDDQLMEDFKKFVNERLFTYQDKGETLLKDLREMGVKANYSVAMMEEIDRLSVQMKEEKETAYDRYKSEILRAIRIEMAARLGGEKGRIRASLPGDVQVQAALNILNSPKRYDHVLAGK